MYDPFGCTADTASDRYWLCEDARGEPILSMTFGEQK